MVPPRELYAHVLMEAGRIEEAARAYEGMVARMPNRTQSLLGAARAADKLNDHDKAREYYAQLAEIWVDSESTPRLSEVRAHLAETSQ